MLNLLWILLLCVLNTGTLVSADNKIANRTIERTVQLRTHSIFAPYIDQDLQNRWWDFGGDAYVNTNKHIRLTRAAPSQMGWLWSRLPLTAANYVIEIEFKVSGESNHLFGDGMAIWLTKGRAEPGPVFGNVDKFEGLGIFLDTYANSRHSYSFPRVVAMLGDGMTNYDHANDGERNSIGSCSANFRRSTIATKLKITYIQNEYLDVKIQYLGWDMWTDCFTIPNIKLPLSPFVGISALTGDVFDAHDVISVTTKSALLSSVDNPRDKLGYTQSSRSSDAASTGTWSGFTLKLFLFLGVCAAGFYGWKQYQLRSVRRFGGGHGRTWSLGGFGGNSKRF